MAEYIEREALEKSIREKANPKGCTHITPQDVYSTVLVIAECEPAADVVEVMHCEQCKYFAKTSSEYPCSHCRNCYTDKFKPKMDLGDDEE